ncbi:MAG: hypothetical protein WC595_01160 [Candidatus Nanoarchaeia archaeon]
MKLDLWTNDPKWKNVNLKDPKNRKKFLQEQFKEMCEFFENFEKEN